MKTDYDPNLPIERLFQQIEDAVAYADHGIFFKDDINKLHLFSGVLRLLVS